MYLPSYRITSWIQAKKVYRYSLFFNEVARMLFYKFIINRKKNLINAILFFCIFVVSELFFDVPVILEALNVSLIILFIIIVINGGEIVDEQIREALETMANSTTRVASYAAALIKHYREFETRLDTINTIELIDNSSTSLVSSITSKTNYFVNCQLRKAYGDLLIVNNKVPSQEDEIRIQKYNDIFNIMLNRLDDIAFEINAHGNSEKIYKMMKDYLSDVLESIKECNY